MGETEGAFSRFSLRRFLLVAILACVGAAVWPTAANAWVDIDSPGEYTNDNTPLIKGDAEINFFVGIHTYTGCSGLGLDVSGICIPYFFFHPTVGYTDVTGHLRRKNGGQHWCPNTCASTIEDIDLGTPTPPIDDLLAYSQPYSWTAPQLSDGPWLLEVFHFGEDPPSPKVTRDFFIDTRAPSGTQITAQPPQFSNDTTPTFDWTASDPAPSSGLDFACNLDGAGWVACPNDKTFTTPEGNHTLEVKAIDKAGNMDPTPDSYAWMVDTTPPSLTINQPHSKGRYLLHQAPAGDFNCVDPLSGGPPPVASGIDTCGATPVNNEDLGPHRFKVDATDKAGNSATKSIAYVIDPPDYGAFVGNDDPLAYYRLDEPVGSADMIDRSGNNHNGIYQNGIALGRNGATSCERRLHPPRACELAHPAENKAGYFPARDGHGYVNGITAPTTAYTMEAWVKPKDGADMMVVSHGGGGQLFIHGGNLAFRQVQDTIYSNGAVEPGKWTHVAATWDGQNTRLYVNGVEVAHSSTANKPPSGTSTFYVGYGEVAPWFHGDMDEVAYYRRALSQHAFEDRVKIGVAKDNPSVEAGNSILNTEGPFTDPVAPKNGGLYAPGKVPNANFSCSDPDDLPGNSDVAVCTATVDGNPILSGAPLPDSIGDHTFVVTAIDEGGNQYIHPHTYTVKSFSSIYGHDNPIAYYRLGDGSGGPMVDASPNGKHGEYKNDQDSGPTGIAGDGDKARDFFGSGGYGYANGINAPRYQSTLEAWVRPAYEHRDQAIVGHGDAGEIFIKDGQFKFRHMDTTVTASEPVKPGVWQQVVGTWDGVDIRIYVDGIESGKTEATKRPSSISTFYVGYGELAPWFSGSIDEVAYYIIALPAARVYQHFLADPPPSDLGDAGGPGDATVSGETSADPPGPDDPTDPADPGDPSDPSDPGDPADPGDPSDPSDPSEGPISENPEPGVETTSGTPSPSCKTATARLKRAKAKHRQAKVRYRKASGKPKRALRMKVERTGKKVSRQRGIVNSSC
ncbi:MAG: LamG-like jellyroll fold domain-containing protein [Solirubrobacterales bacterium]